jgi:hypothetical protein
MTLASDVYDGFGAILGQRGDVVHELATVWGGRAVMVHDRTTNNTFPVSERELNRREDEQCQGK